MGLRCPTNAEDLDAPFPHPRTVFHGDLHTVVVIGSPDRRFDLFEAPANFRVDFHVLVLSFCSS